MNCLLPVFKMLPDLMSSNNIQEMRELKLSGLIYNQFNSFSASTSPQERAQDALRSAQHVAATSLRGGARPPQGGRD